MKFRKSFEKVIVLYLSYWFLISFSPSLFYYLYAKLCIRIRGYKILECI